MADLRGRCVTGGIYAALLNAKSRRSLKLKQFRPVLIHGCRPVNANASY